MFASRRHLFTSAIIKGRKPFSLTFTLAGEDGEPSTLRTTRDLTKYFSPYIFKHPVTGELRDAEFLAKNVNRPDPSIIYEAHHRDPSFYAYQKGITHNQVTDRAFEDRTIQAVERHLMARYNVARWSAANPERENGWRYLTGERDIAEWDGIWRGKDGHMFFLEAKHCMSMVKLPKIKEKLIRSIEFLDIPRSSATVFAAGNYWQGKHTIIEAKETYTFGVVHSNGQDLDVQEPS